MHERPWNLTELAVKEYEAYYKKKYQRADVLEKRLLKKLLERFDNVERLLEVGCGTAHFTRWMETIGSQCYGLDVSKLMLAEARNLWINSRLIQGESAHLPFKSKSFDIITFVTSLEFMPSVVTVLSEATRVAKKGIIIGLRNKWNASTIWRMIRARIWKSEYYKNANFYSISDIKRIVNENFSEKYHIVYWSTTVFPRQFGNTVSSLFPFGAFLAIAIKLDDRND